MILDPSFRQAIIVLKTSSDSKMLLAYEILLLIDPIKKARIDRDLSESTLIDLEKGFILCLILNEYLFGNIIKN